MSKKRRREPLAANVRLVETYEDLAHEDEKVRLKAAQTLVTEFILQEATTVDQLNDILRRLIRGSCSGRKAARLGYSIALTESLTVLLGHDAKEVPGLHSIVDLIDVLEQQTRVSGNVSGQVCKFAETSQVELLRYKISGSAGSPDRTPFCCEISNRIGDFIPLRRWVQVVESDLRHYLRFGWEKGFAQRKVWLCAIEYDPSLR